MEAVTLQKLYTSNTIYSTYFVSLLSLLSVLELAALIFFKSLHKAQKRRRKKHFGNDKSAAVLLKLGTIRLPLLFVHPRGDATQTICDKYTML